MNQLNPQEIQAFQAIGQGQQPESVQAAQDAPPAKPGGRKARTMDTSPIAGLKALAATIARDNDPDKDYDDQRLDRLWDEKGVWIGIYPQEHTAYKLELFIQHFIANGYKAAAAAVSSGYCHETESEWHKNTKGAMLRRSLRKQIRARVDNVAAGLGIDAVWVMSRIKAIADANIHDYLSPGGGGAITDLSALPREMLAGIAEISVDQIMEGRGDDKRYVGDNVKIKLHKQNLEALKLLGGHIKAIDIKPDTSITVQQAPAPVLNIMLDMGALPGGATVPAARRIESREVIPGEALPDQDDDTKGNNG